VVGGNTQLVQNLGSLMCSKVDSLRGRLLGASTVNAKLKVSPYSLSGENYNSDLVIGSTIAFTIDC
jgi:hypothetical protein